jgi:hypothetical protein
LKLLAPIPRPSRDSRTLLPAALVGALALMAMLQFALPTDTDLPLATGRAIPAKLQDRDAVRVIPDPAILTSALFTPTRAGRRASASDVAAGPLDGAAPVGIARGRGFARVVLQQADGTAVSLSPGQAYHGWRLVSIGRDQVKFSQNGQPLLLSLSNGTALRNVTASPRQAEER